MTTLTLTARAGFVSLMMTGTLALAQALPTPASQVPTPAGPAGAPAPGRGNRPPLTESDAAEIAKLDLLPPWTRGAGNGNY
ncbi:MAG: hypothetical protein ABJC89_16415, partial [Acidobacteriota bacterium]